MRNGKRRSRGAFTGTPCRACRTPKPSRFYLCSNCWAQLPDLARQRLERTDARAHARLRELYAHIDSGRPLTDLEISA